MKAVQRDPKKKRVATTRKGTYYQMFKKGISRKRLLLILCLCLIPLLTGFEFLGFASYSWHQKMTVEVKVNGEVYSGASVVAMSVFRHPDIPMVHGIWIWIWREKRSWLNSLTIGSCLRC